MWCQKGLKNKKRGKEKSHWRSKDKDPRGRKETFCMFTANFSEVQTCVNKPV